MCNLELYHIETIKTPKLPRTVSRGAILNWMSSDASTGQQPAPRTIYRHIISHTYSINAQRDYHIS